MGEDDSDDVFDSDEDEDDDENDDVEEPRAESPPSPSIVAQRLPLKLGSRVRVRFDDGKWYGGRVMGQSGFLNPTTPSEVCIVYDDGEVERIEMVKE